MAVAVDSIFLRAAADRQVGRTVIIDGNIGVEDDITAQDIIAAVVKSSLQFCGIVNCCLGLRLGGKEGCHCCEADGEQPFFRIKISHNDISPNVNPHFYNISYFSPDFYSKRQNRIGFSAGSIFGAYRKFNRRFFAPRQKTKKANFRFGLTCYFHD